ncbi:MAG TPA: RidA family protein [Candidatus Eisenbacteria bacterium]|nr:RidA family protein [Candidatus Eisenbacteria bacterium]
MSRKNVSTGAPWEPIVGYSRAVRVGPLVQVAGTAAVGLDGRVVAPGNGGEQARVILGIIERALAETGARLEHVTRTRIYVTDISQWEAIGRAHGERFASIRPATTMIEVSKLIDPGMVVEIEAEAWIEG